MTVSVEGFSFVRTHKNIVSNNKNIKKLQKSIIFTKNRLIFHHNEICVVWIELRFQFTEFYIEFLNEEKKVSEQTFFNPLNNEFSFHFRNKIVFHYYDSFLFRRKWKIRLTPLINAMLKLTRLLTIPQRNIR